MTKKSSKRRTRAKHHLDNTSGGSTKKPIAGWSLQKWVAIITITAGFFTIALGLLAVLPSVRTYLETYREISNPSQLVTIQNSLFSQSVAKLIEEDDPSQLSFQELSTRVPAVECLNYQYPECEVILYLGKWASPSHYSVHLVVSSSAKLPVIINGLSVTLVDYRPLIDDVQEVFENQTLGAGGGKVYRAYSLSEFPLGSAPSDPSTMQMQRLTDDPTQSIGTSQLARPNCQGVSLCEEVVYLEDTSDVEGIELTMPFIEKLLPGWYSFELDVAFSYNGEPYNSEDKIRFDVIKPDTVHFWYGWPDRLLQPEILQFSVTTGKYEVPTMLPAARNDPGLLIFQHESTNLILNLRTNKMTAFPLTGYYLPGEQMIIDSQTFNQISPKGTHLVSTINHDTGSDLELIDLHSLEITQLTSSPTVRETHPSWSPSGRKIAFLGLALSDTPTLKTGEADLFTYDLDSGLTQRVTSTPSILEAYPTWINEDEISFLFDTQNSSQPEMDFGLAVVDVIYGNTRIINQLLLTDPYVNDMDYLPANDLLAISIWGDGSMLFDLEGQLQLTLESQDPTSSRCTLLDKVPLVQLCVAPQGVYLTNIANDEVLPVITYPSDLSSQDWPLTVEIPSDGFAILDKSNGFLIQYEYPSTEIERWSLGGLKELGGLERVYNPVLLPDVTD